MPVNELERPPFSREIVSLNQHALVLALSPLLNPAAFVRSNAPIHSDAGRGDRRRYEDRCARIPSRPGTNGFHKQAGYITATVFAIASKCDLQRRGRPYIYRRRGWLRGPAAGNTDSPPHGGHELQTSALPTRRSGLKRRAHERLWFMSEATGSSMLPRFGGHIGNVD